jgi:hypothetical protein
MHGSTSGAHLCVLKKIGLNYSVVLTSQIIYPTINKYLEIRASGNIVQIFYNDTQVGMDLTILDPELINNIYHGMFSTGGNFLQSFFCSNQIFSMAITFAGSSWTFGTGYRPDVSAWLYNNHLNYKFTFILSAKSSHNIWSNLVRLSRDSLAGNPAVIILEHANGLMTDETMEALIRRVWTASPTTKIILIEAPSWLNMDYHDNAIVTTPINTAAMSVVNATAAHYGIPIIRWWEWAKSFVPEIYDLDEIISDGVHPTILGYSYISSQTELYLAQGFNISPTTLPDRLYDCEDYENESIIKVGTDYDSKTGTWSEIGTVVESSEADATITYSATCQSFGCYRADGVYQSVQISIDGGIFSALPFYQNGYAIPSGRGLHTITVKVVSDSVRIEEFWAI